VVEEASRGAAAVGISPGWEERKRAEISKAEAFVFRNI
jgi:hypothetical protein